MPKYMILYNATQDAQELMTSSTPEQMKASMSEWITWKEEADKTFKIKWGLPMHAVALVTSSGVIDSPSQVSGYAMAEGDSKNALVEHLISHPHLKRQDATLDVLELLPMPGLNT